MVDLDPAILQKDILEPGSYTRGIFDRGVSSRAVRQFLFRFASADLPLTDQKAHIQAVRKAELEPGLLTSNGFTHPQDATLFVDRINGRRIGTREVLVTATYRTLAVGGGFNAASQNTFNRRPAFEATPCYRTLKSDAGDYVVEQFTGLPAGDFLGNATDSNKSPKSWTWMRPVQKFVFRRTYSFDPVAFYDLKTYDSSINTAGGPGGPDAKTLRYDGADVDERVIDFVANIREYRCRFYFTQISQGQWFGQGLTPIVGPIPPDGLVWETPGYQLYPAFNFATVFAFL